MKTITIIGGGNMGAAILSRVRRKFSAYVCEKDQTRQEFLKRTLKIKSLNLSAAVKKSEIIILAVKPQDFAAVLNDIRPLINPKKLIISIAAGITTVYIEKQLGSNARVIRTMPNMPAQIGEGITAICGGRFTKKVDLDSAVKIFSCVGKAIVVREEMLDAVTAVSGSGPAYIFLVVEYLIKAAQSLGFNENQAKGLVYQTLLGSSHLLEKGKDSATELRAKVISKGGTTQAAMDVFAAHNLAAVFEEAVAAAAKRAKELSQ